MSIHLSSAHILLYLMMLMSSLMAISSNNLMMTWAALEINMLAFIPLINSSNKFQESEAMLKYFLVQTIGSSVFLIMASTMWWNDLIINKYMISFMVMLSMLIKLGMAPCHMWFPSVMTSISWTSCMILSTWQKLAPMSILTFIMYSSMKYIMLIPIINAIIGSIMGMNQTKMKSIMAFSSITHMGWMSSFLIINKPMFSIIYLIMYSLIIVPTFMFLYYNTLNSMNNMTYMSIPLIILILSLGGIPPFMGFMPKWMTLYIMIDNMSIIIFLLMGSMMNLYFYLNILFSSMLSYKYWSKSMDKMFSFLLIILASSSLPLMIMIFM